MRHGGTTGTDELELNCKATLAPGTLRSCFYLPLVKTPVSRDSAGLGKSLSLRVGPSSTINKDLPTWSWVTPKRRFAIGNRRRAIDVRWHVH